MKLFLQKNRPSSYQKLTNEPEASSLHTRRKKYKKLWLGKVITFIKVAMHPFVWKELIHKLNPLPLRARQSITHTKQKSLNSASAPVKIDFRFTGEAFRIGTLYQQFSCPEAKKLAKMLDKAESMKTKGGLENILLQAFEIKNQNALFKNYVEQSPQQYFSFGVTKKGERVKLVSPDEQKENADVYDLRKERLNTVKIIEQSTDALLETVGPKKELDKITALHQEYGKGSIEWYDYQQQLNKQMAALNKKDQDYQKIRFSSNPNIKDTVQQWTQQIETFKRQQFK